MNRITFKQFLMEAPIGDYKTIGNFDKGSSYRHLRDRKMITSPRAIDIVKKKFNNNENTFNLYFVNSAAADKWTEVGVVDLDWVKKNLGEEVAKEVSPHYGGDDINVIFTNNKGAENMPMTPWMMAHRIAHALGRRGGYPSRNQVSSYKEANDVIINCMKRIFEFYNISWDVRPDQYTGGEYRKTRKSQLMMKHFFTSVCTFRSARKNQIREWFEVLHELFAQYITTGKIKFNPVPKTFGSKIAFGKGTGQYSIKDSDMQDANEHLENLAEDLKWIFEGMLTEVSGKILVM